MGGGHDRRLVVFGEGAAGPALRLGQVERGTWDARNAPSALDGHDRSR